MHVTAKYSNKSYTIIGNYNLVLGLVNGKVGHSIVMKLHTFLTVLCIYVQYFVTIIDTCLT